jgi:hypothetical protein
MTVRRSHYLILSRDKEVWRGDRRIRRNGSRQAPHEPSTWMDWSHQGWVGAKPIEALFNVSRYLCRGREPAINPRKTRKKNEKPWKSVSPDRRSITCYPACVPRTASMPGRARDLTATRFGRRSAKTRTRRHGSIRGNTLRAQARIASFDVALNSFAPKGPPQNSPGQRPRCYPQVFGSYWQTAKDR